MNDIITNKIASIDRCIKRVESVYARTGDLFKEDIDRQDLVVLSLTRACEQCISLANHIIKKYQLGIPTESKDSFELLRDASVIPRELCTKLTGMTGFRNKCVHEYQEIKYDVVESVVRNNLQDMYAFTDYIRDYVLKRG